MGQTVVSIRGRKPPRRSRCAILGRAHDLLVEWAGWALAGRDRAYRGSTIEAILIESGGAQNFIFASKPPKGAERKDKRERLIDSIIRRLNPEMRMAIAVKYLSTTESEAERCKLYSQLTSEQGYRRRVEIAESQVLAVYDILHQKRKTPESLR